MAQQITAQDSTYNHGMALKSMAQQGRHGKAQHGAQHLEHDQFSPGGKVSPPLPRIHPSLTELYNADLCCVATLLKYASE